MRIVSMLVVVLGIAAIENGSGKSLGNVAARSLANIPGVKNDTEIGAETSSSGFLIFLECTSEYSNCLEDEECNQCVNAQTDDDDDDGSENDDNFSCDEFEKEWCDSGLWLEDTCYQNEEYAAWWGECFRPQKIGRVSRVCVPQDISMLADEPTGRLRQNPRTCSAKTCANTFNFPPLPPTKRC